jgi:muramidase (phage lysozyme)
LNLPDFSPESQDAIALQQIREQKAIPDILAGRFDEAVKKCSNIWASLPGAGYGQHENELSKLRTAFVAAGGVLGNDYDDAVSQIAELNSTLDAYRKACNAE